MSKTFSRSLARKKVMSNDGMLIGTVRNIMVDLDTGQVVDLIVKPDDTFRTDEYRMDGDKMFVPFEAVKDIKDYIVVDRYLLKRSGNTFSLLLRTHPHTLPASPSPPLTGSAPGHLQPRRRRRRP